ncbi:MAG: ATP synthase F1 subunit delta [Nitrospiraceae bacterium]|nr:ATP synthase F1 subunit delta [Nitrospiraceae bacterium]
MKKVKGVKKYARQFIKGVEQAGLESSISAVSAIAAKMESDKKFRSILAGPVFSDSEKLKVIDALAADMKLSAKTAAYLKYLSDIKAISALPEISRAIEDIYLEMNNKVKAFITTAVPVSTSTTDEVVLSIGRITGKAVDAEFAVDPSLLGGVTVKVGSKMYDSSIKGQLGLLKDKLIKG